MSQRVIIVGAALVLATLVACEQGSNRIPSVAQAQEVLSRTIRLAAEKDYERLCAQSGAPDVCMNNINASPHSVPAVPPRVICTFTTDGDHTPAARILRLRGRHDDRTHYTFDFTVLHDGTNIFAHHPAYWTGIGMDTDGLPCPS